MKEILGKLYEYILKNYYDVDLRDRTYYFYNLLKNDVDRAEFIIAGERTVIDKFYDDFEGENLVSLNLRYTTYSLYTAQQSFLSNIFNFIF